MVTWKTPFAGRAAVDWKPLLAGRADGFSTAVGGARVGGGVGAVLEDPAARIHPSTPSPDRSSGSEGVFDIQEDGRRVPVPRDTLIAELLRHGGRIYVDKVTVEVARGAIEKIWVRGDALRGLPFAAEADIERALGPALGVERTLGWAVHHFPDRGLSVAWHTREGRVEHVALGPVAWRPPVFGAADVLREWLAAAHAGLAPGWQEPADRSSSLWVRYARVSALLRAFGLGSPEDFANGRFLEGRPLDAYPLAASAIEAGPWARSRRRDAAQYGDALARLFWWLLVYRTQAQELLALNDGWLEAGHPGILTALDVTRQANEDVRDALADVDALLEQMIAPRGDHVAERDLVARWGFPDVDLGELLSEEV